MTRLKLIAASVASLGIIVLTPVAAHASCNQCYGGCLDAYGEDNSESGYYMLSQCFNGCVDSDGRLCSQSAPG